MCINLSIIRHRTLCYFTNLYSCWRDSNYACKKIYYHVRIIRIGTNFKWWNGPWMFRQISASFVLLDAQNYNRNYSWNCWLIKTADSLEQMLCLISVINMVIITDYAVSRKIYSWTLLKSQDIIRILTMLTKINFAISTKII